MKLKSLQQGESDEKALLNPIARSFIFRLCRQRSIQRTPKKSLCLYGISRKKRIKMFDTVKERMSVYILEKKLVKIVTNIAIIQFIVILALIVCILSLFPLKEKEPYLIEVANAQKNFVILEKAGGKLTANDALKISLVDNYVRNRETINHIDDDLRYELVRFQSTSRVWQDFEGLYSNKNSIYNLDNFKRNIEIINTSFLSDKVATADFIATELLDGRIKKKKFRAIIYFIFKPQEIAYNDIVKNPVGFFVTDYAVQPINEESKQ